MKQNLKNILLIINTILLVICLVQISELRTELQNMRNNTGNSKRVSARGNTGVFPIWK